jgi:aryl-alcohol dehydrogenase-like predicted oxidoreductase
VRVFDTAQVYGPVTNEESVDEALEHVRDRVGSCAASLAGRHGHCFEDGTFVIGGTDRDSITRISLEFWSRGSLAKSK